MKFLDVELEVLERELDKWEREFWSIVDSGQEPPVELKKRIARLDDRLGKALAECDRRRENPDEWKRSS